MKYIIYISLLLFTYSCKTKKTVETPASKLWQSGIDTITLPVNDTITVPPYGSELIFDSSWITIGDNTKPLKLRIKKHHKKRDWASIIFDGDSKTKDGGKIGFGYDTSDTAVQNLMFGLDLGVGRTKVDSSIGNEFKRHITLGVEGDTETIYGGDSVPKGEKIFFAYGSIKPKPVYDTLKTIVSYVDTSVEARPNVIDWKYLYYVRRIDVLFSRDNYYLELDKKRIKSSIVVLEARILDPK